MNTKPPEDQPLVVTENNTKTQQELERKQKWEKAKKMHLKKYRKVLGYRKTENDRRGKRRKTNGGYKGGKQGTRTNEEEQRKDSTRKGAARTERSRQKAEVQRKESTINGELGRSRQSAGKDKRSSIEDIEVQEKQTGPIPKEPD